MGDPARSQRGLRRRHGGRAGNLPGEPRDADHPLVCLDETSKQLIAETRTPIPAKPGQPARHDYEYEREPRRQSLHDLRAARGVAARRSDRPPRRSRLRESPQRPIRRAFPRRRENRAGSGQPGAHTLASLYAAFPAPEARRLVERFEWRYTPKHGSWLNMAESELAVLTRQCLSRRIPDKNTTRERSRRLAEPSKQTPRQSRLAIHHSRRPRQTQKAVPQVRMTRATSPFMQTPPQPGLLAPNEERGKKETEAL